jgi:hypothetical protein
MHIRLELGITRYSLQQDEIVAQPELLGSNTTKAS